MSSALLVLIVVVALVVMVGLFIWGLYNGLVRSRMQVQESWSGIDVQLKRRYSLIPNLVETVKGYAAHEREVLENVTRARAALMGAGDARSAAEANNQLTGALKTLFAVAENYPQLRASENFMQLQKELSDIEAKIAYARQFYNGNVMSYNMKIQVFPNVLLARSLGFAPADFFAATEAERAEVRVSFEKKPA
ncbi:MAG: LemA family protein [Chloroflexi bacterium]|nr:LemA family protein [Chloroflexota bacterium]